MIRECPRAAVFTPRATVPRRAYACSTASGPPSAPHHNSGRWADGQTDRLRRTGHRGAATIKGAAALGKAIPPEALPPIDLIVAWSGSPGARPGSVRALASGGVELTHHAGQARVVERRLLGGVDLGAVADPVVALAEPRRQRVPGGADGDQIQ